MAAVAQTPEVARPPVRSVWDVAEVCLATASFAMLCVLVLRATPYLPEPDDNAYRASIVAMTDGHFFTLSWPQAHALAEQLAPQLGQYRLGPGPGGGPVQWVQLAGDRWISEKDPGYPYLAVAFQALGLIRLAPLFYGALACLGLYFGGRRWPGSAVAWWLVSVCVFGVGVAIFDTLIYGGPLRSGYRPGEIKFSLDALGPNLRYMPAHLIQAMPVLVLGLGALAGIAVTWLRGRRAGGQQAATARRDLAVALALAACWAAVWVLYATYTWTAVPRLSTLQAARFYVPALGAISLLGAWLLVRLPRRQPFAAVTTLVVVAALFGLGSWAFRDMYRFPFGPQFAVVPGPGGTVELKPGPGAMIGGPGRMAPSGRGRAVQLQLAGRTGACGSALCQTQTWSYAHHRTETRLLSRSWICAKSESLTCKFVSLEPEICALAGGPWPVPDPADL